jgi:hypothetical protein
MSRLVGDEMASGNERFGENTLEELRRWVKLG